MVIGHLELAPHARRALDFDTVDAAAGGSAVAEITRLDRNVWLRPVRCDVVVHTGDVVDDEGRTACDIPGQRGSHPRDRSGGDVPGRRIERYRRGYALDGFLDVIDANPQAVGQLVQ